MSSFVSFKSLLLAFGLNAAMGTANPITPKANGVTAVGYFAGYHATRGAPVSDIQWTKYSHVLYSFAETSPDMSLNLTASHPELLPEFVSAAKAKGVKAMVSVGGWTGSMHFSTMVGSPENRTKAVATCLGLVSQFKLDGLDFDWEYPNRQGLGCNAINPNDTANFLAFLQELRQQPSAKDLIFMAAAPLAPWHDANGRPSTSGLDGFAKVLDNIILMNYDVHGAWAPVAGPNAPLDRSCDPRNTQGAAKQSVEAWTAAGVPANKLLLGVPAYGHAFSVSMASAFSGNNTSELALYPPQNSSNRFQGSSWDSDPPIDPCGKPQPPGGTYPLWSLVKEAGFLNETGQPAPGIAYRWDSCAQTPNIYDPKTQRYVSYDDAQSFVAKGKFVQQNGLAGFALFETGGDYKNILIDAIRGATGLP